MAQSKVELFEMFGQFSGTLPEVAVLITKVAEHAEDFLLDYLLQDSERIEPILALTESPRAEMTREEVIRGWLYLTPNNVILQHHYASSGRTPGPPEANQGCKTLVWHRGYDLVLLYHNGRFLYALKEPNKNFWYIWHHLKMIPARDCDLQQYGTVVHVEPWEKCW